MMRSWIHFTRGRFVRQARVGLGELREELFNLRFRNTMKQLDNPLKIRESRREMARLLTVLKEKESTGGQAPARSGKS